MSVPPSTEPLALAPPILADVGLLALVPEAWSENWQVRQQVLTRLAEYFEVLWMDPPHAWRDSGRAFANWLERRRLQTATRPGFRVYVPEPWLPQVYRPGWVSRLLFRLRLRAAVRILRRKGCRKLILHVWRPQFAPALDLRGFDLRCYEIDDEYTFSPVPTPTDDTERHLIERADQVFVHSPGLMEKKGSINPHTTFIPNGVPYESFARVAPEPLEMAPIPHPRIGYVGMIKKHLDWDLLRALARKHPSWSFVFLGHLAPHRELPRILDEMRRLPNAYFLPGRPSAELAAFPQHFDVCIMPYIADDFSRFGYPLKLHEYLASGRPAVGTRMRTLEDFAHVITLAQTVEEWSCALARALGPEENTPQRRSLRQATAREHDWDLLVARMARQLAARLGPSHLERLDRSLRARGEDPTPEAH